MTIVIADTSPINYLILIGEIEILPRLYSRIVIPEEVFAELRDQSAPYSVSQWAVRPPEWIEVRKAPVELPHPNLDRGEAAALALAALESDVLLLIDESDGRREATRRQIPNTGTLGVLRTAAIRGFVDLPSALDRLTATNFRVSESLLHDLLAEDSARRGQA